MPKLTQYGETIEVSDEKAAVYVQQGWQDADAVAEADSADDGTAKTAVKRPAKKAAKKS